MGYNKYRSKKYYIDGYKFDSKKEAKRYQELKLLEEGKVISNLILQPKFELQPKFRYDGKGERAIHYIADFIYWDIENSCEVVEDVKGFKTTEYKLKRKLFLYNWGNRYKFVEIK